MTRNVLAKTVAFLLCICLLGVGIAPASTGCNSSCCVAYKGQDPTDPQPSSSSIVPPCCCSETESSPCNASLNQFAEIPEYTFSAVLGESDIQTLVLAFDPTGSLSHRRTRQSELDTILNLARPPTSPLYLKNLSLLI
jgi:hypothetical protein